MSILLRSSNCGQSDARVSPSVRSIRINVQYEHIFLRSSGIYIHIESTISKHNIVSDIYLRNQPLLTNELA